MAFRTPLIKNFSPGFIIAEGDDKKWVKLLVLIF